MLEFALFLPVLLIMIAGLIEVGAYANTYMVYLDASREAARFGANLDPELTSQNPFDNRWQQGFPAFPDVWGMTPEQLREVCRQGETTNFYYEVACLAYQNIPLGGLDPNQGDDIVITVIRVRNGAIIPADAANPTGGRWPVASYHRHPSDQAYHFLGEADGRYCWSLYGVHESEFDNAELTQRLRTGAPATGFVIVEIFHSQPHFTGFFRIGEFIPDPIPFRAYSVFPVSAAEPD